MVNLRSRDDTQIGLAILLILSAVFCFALLNTAGKFLSETHSVIQIIWARYMFALALLLVMFLPKRGITLFRTRRPGIQLLRGVLLVGSSFLFFIGVSKLPLTTAATITATGPLLITALSVPFLGETVGIRRWIAVAVGFSGALIVIRPGGDGADWWILFFIGSTACGTFYQLITRKMGYGENAETSATLTALVGAVAGCIVGPFFWQTPGSFLEIGLFVGLGALAGIGHYLLTLAYQRGPASVVAPFNYSHIVWATILGLLVFGNFPDAWTIVGASVIVSAGLYVAHREAVVRKRLSA